MFLCGEIGNTWAHQKLRALRAQSGVSHKSIPVGGLFEWVSCPHYFFEIMSWCGFFWVTRLWASAIFLSLGTAIVMSYAQARHRAYKKEFDGEDGRVSYPSRRKAVLPGIF